MGVVVEKWGFYDGDGDGKYRVRFMSKRAGEWSYTTRSDTQKLDGTKGSFSCVANKSGNHGPVGVREPSLRILAASPFNKIRMCVFPKHYDYNHNEPELYPFPGGEAR